MQAFKEKRYILLEDIPFFFEILSGLELCHDIAYISGKKAWFDAILQPQLCLANYDRQIKLK